MGGSNFAKAATNYFWVDPTQHNTRNEASQLSQSVIYFQEKKLSHKCSTLVFKRPFVAATVYQGSPFWTGLRT